MTLSMDVRPTHGPLNRSLAVRLVLPGLVLLVAVVGHFAAAAWGERREHEHRRELAEASASHLATRISQYGDALYGLRGLFAASDEVTHAEFRESAAASAVARRFPGVRVIGFAPLIAPGGIAHREHALRRSAARSHLGYPR